MKHREKATQSQHKKETPKSKENPWSLSNNNPKITLCKNYYTNTKIH